LLTSLRGDIGLDCDITLYTVYY